MYEHQVIESLKNYNLKGIALISKTYISDIISLIRSSQKICLGDYGDLKIFFKKQIEKDQMPFTGFFSGSRLPFKLCWFDYYTEKRSYPTDLSDRHSLKRGILCREMSEDVISLITFHMYEDNKSWVTPPITYYIPTKSGVSMEKLKSFLTSSNSEYDETSFALVEYHAPKSEISIGKSNELLSKVRRTDLVLSLFRNCSLDLLTLSYGLRLLTFKNIAIAKNYPSEPLNKKRIKNGKEPCYMFYDLKVRPLKYLKKDENYEGESIKNLTKLHLCMGHPKTYTKEKPLFGKYSGTFWWNEQTRGDIKNGMVVKNYQLLTS